MEIFQIVLVCTADPDKLRGHFWLFSVSPLTIRLPTILIAAVTILIFYRAMRSTLGEHPSHPSECAPRSNLVWARGHLVRFRCGWIYLWKSSRDNLPSVFWLIVIDGFLALACLLSPMSNFEARENRQKRYFLCAYGLADFRADRDHTSGDWCAPLL